MNTSGWTARVDIPLDDLGRIRIPLRIRYRDGWVRLGLDSRKTHLIATLVDRDDFALSFSTQTEACAKAALMGKVICHHLMKHNRYEPGESVGNRELVQMAVA